MEQQITELSYALDTFYFLICVLSQKAMHKIDETLKINKIDNNPKNPDGACSKEGCNGGI